MSQILVVGNALIDHIYEVSHYPAEDEELRAMSQTQTLGGNSTNTAQVLQQLGHLCTLLNTFAADSQGEWLRQQLEQQGIKISYSPILAGYQTPNSVILLNQQSGSRTIIHHRHLPELAQEALNNLPLAQYDWFHFEGRNVEVLPHLIGQVRQVRKHQLISLELEKNRVGLEVLIGLVDVVFISQAYWQAQYPHLTPQQWLQQLNSHYPHTIMTLTLGKQGALVLERGGEIQHVTVPAVQVVDTVGAGDTFNAGMIAALCEGQNALEAVHFAVQLAQRKVQQYGLARLVKH